jgi:nicotinate dehydrogenase subunit B
MAPKNDKNELTRREFVKDAGGLLIAFSLADATILPQVLAASPAGTVMPPSPDRLDAWLRIEADGTIRVFTGKNEIGMGVQTALAQIVAEELDAPFETVVLVMCDTATTPDQGGVGGSTSISTGAQPLRNAAATGRAVLVELASRRLGVPADQLQVKNAIVSVKSDPSRNVSYRDLVGGTDLTEPLKVVGDGFVQNVLGRGKPKEPASYTVVGQSIPRVDIPPKILGHFNYVGDIRVPGMLHGRAVRPSAVGASLISVDENSIKGIPGFVKTVVKGNFVGVVAETEWSAIRAAQQLKVNWGNPAAPFPGDLYQHMRSVTPRATKPGLHKGDTTAALSNAAKKLQASYEWPFQAHATMGPGCAVADVHAGDVTTVWSGSQKPHALQRGIADLLHTPSDMVRVIWVQDAGSYGRAGYEDVAADAVLLSQSVGKPVRVQWARSDMTQWGAKAPAVIFDLVGGLDAQGGVSAVEFTSRAFSGTEIVPRGTTADQLLAGQLTDLTNTTGTDEFAEWGTGSPPYSFQNVLAVGHVLPTLYAAASPLRGTHMRDPNGPATTFAVESFMDELAAAAGTDPIEFRLKYIDDPRAKAVLHAAAERAGWAPRPSPGKTAADKTDVATGRGVALGIRAGTYVATIAEVQVNRRSGAIRVLSLVCAHDCGLVVNPDGLRGVIAANLVQSMSRGLKEEVKFDQAHVTSRDWNSYPVARASDVPDKVEIILISDPKNPPGGAGEPSSRPTAAAIANAVFDATGARVRQAPLTAARIKAALAPSTQIKTA